MSKKVITLIFVLSLSVFVISEIFARSIVIGNKVYSEKVLENFESSRYTAKNIFFRAVKNRQAGDLRVGGLMPAPNINSRKYLQVKVFGKYGDSFTIIPAKKLYVNQYCSSLGIWVYGKRFSGQLYIYVRDSKRKMHRLMVGTLNYLGWKKMIVYVSNIVSQIGQHGSGTYPLQIVKIVYIPRNDPRRHPKWQYFYLDDITAMVRQNR